MIRIARFVFISLLTLIHESRSSVSVLQLLMSLTKLQFYFLVLRCEHGTSELFKQM